MFIPCYGYCYLKYGKQYSEECDANCDYAKVVKENKCKDKIIDYLLDMLEEEHMGMCSVAVTEIKNK